MDIDKLFKVPKIPMGGNKRKLPDNPTPDMLKRMKFDSSSDVSASSPSTLNTAQTKHQNTSIHSVVTIEELDDVETNGNFAPGGDADYFAEEDDEGRFFGGGLTSEQKEILNIFETAVGDGAQDEADELSITGIRRILARFERAVHKNQDYRSKYPNDPSKFIDSEADLDSAIKSLLPLSQAPALAYFEFVKSGTIMLLIGLLTHDNLDIVIDVVELIHELTDEDVGEQAADHEVEDTSEEALEYLVNGLVENSILELLVDNLSRMNEEEETDRQGVFHVLAIFENLLGVKAELSTALGCKTKIIKWLLNRIQTQGHDENRGYAAELLSILLQNNNENRLELGKVDGLEILLKTLSQYRRKDPTNADEVEFMENLFDTLCSALSIPSLKSMFLAAEGPDLMVLMMKEKLHAKSLAIKTLDYAMSGPAGVAVCEAFVEALGLKTLFAEFMGKVNRKQKAFSLVNSLEDTAHILGIIASLFSHLSSDSPARIRLLAKFAEGNYEKVDKLLEIRDSAGLRLKATDLEIETEKDELITNDHTTEEDADAWYLRRLDGGLFTLQLVDYIVAWIIMEDDGIRAHTLQMLGRKNLSIEDVLKTLRVYHDNVDETTSSENANAEGEMSQKGIIQSLIEALVDVPP